MQEQLGAAPGGTVVDAAVDTAAVVPAPAPMRSASGALLEVRNVRVRYRNGGLGVLDVSLTVAPGEIVGLFGPNGAGKTTSVRAVSGFLRTEGAKLIRGTVRLAGENVTNCE